MAFPDHFSAIADTYAQYRPTYPAALIDWFAGSAPARATAWDCGCGSGQATVALAERFEHVIATDPSSDQIGRAPTIANVEWRVAAAESSGLADHSVDAIAVAQALHWFDFGRFWPEVIRVARPGALFAAWTYGMPHFDDESLTAEVRHFHDEVVGAYWPIERGHVVNRYGTVDFPFTAMGAPRFELTAEWTLDAFAGYLRSWSATGRYIKVEGCDPVAAFEAELGTRWVTDIITVRWPITVLAGFVTSARAVDRA